MIAHLRRLLPVVYAVWRAEWLRASWVSSFSFQESHAIAPSAYNCAMASPSYTNDDQAEVLGVLNEYYSAFSTLKIEAVLPYFHEPSSLIGP